MLLRRRFESGEEVAVSAILGADAGTEDRLPREALVKVCIKKPGLSSILQFDCRGFGDYRVPNFEIDNAYYIASTSGLDSSAYKGPSFRCFPLL